MPDPRIILVDGMPGTGKSTVSQFINLQLNANNRPAFWCHEERASHPLCLFFDPQRHLSWSDYSQEGASRWQSYADELRGQDQIAVLDAALLQNHVRSMLIFNCDRNAILDLVHRIENLIASLDPVLIYLKPQDVERNFHDVVEVRGQRLLELWIEAHDQYAYTRRALSGGYPGFIAFWEQFGEISDCVFGGLTISKLRQIASNDDWDDRYAEILDFLSLPRATDPWPSSAFERFTGRYVPLDDHNATGFFLQSRDGCLVASVDRPTFDSHRGPIGRFREVRLIPQGEDRFYVAAWPHEVQFIEDRIGTNVQVRATVSEDGAAEFSAVYLKR